MLTAGGKPRPRVSEKGKKLDIVKEVIIPLGSAVLGSGIVGAVLGWGLNSLAKRHDDLSKEVKSLRDEKIVKMEKSLEKEDKNLKDDLHKTEVDLNKKIDKVESNLDRHKEADVSQQVLTELKTLNNTTSRTDARVAKIAEDTASQAAQIQANKEYIGNLDDSFQKHKAKETH